MEKKNKKLIIIGIILTFIFPIVGIPVLIIALEDPAKKAAREERKTQRKNNAQNTNVDNAQVNKKKTPLKRTAKILIFSAIPLTIMIVGVIITLTVNGTIGKMILTISGIIEIILAILIFYIMWKVMMYTCPECGTKRQHHQTCLETTSNSYNQPNRIYRPEFDKPIGCRITKYTHKYLHTYVCPKCGETEKEYKSEDGGFVYTYVDGVVIDKRKPARNF